MPRADEPRDEKVSERADRNLSELPQELWVALPGVQVAPLSAVRSTVRAPDGVPEGSALVFAWLWFVRLMRRRLRLEDEPHPRTAPWPNTRCCKRDSGGQADNGTRQAALHPDPAIVVRRGVRPVSPATEGRWTKDR